MQIYECKQKNKVNRCLLRHKIKTHRQVVGGGLSSSSSTPKMHCSFERTCGENVNSSLRATIVGKVQKFNLIWFEIQFHGSKFISTGLVQSSMWTGPENGQKKTRRVLECVCLRRRQFSGMFKAAKGLPFPEKQTFTSMFKPNWPNVQPDHAKVQFNPNQNSI